jgi:hypothetical protein
MRFKNVPDGCFSLPAEIKIYVDIPQWIDDRRFALAFDIIRRFTKTAGIQLLDEHNHAFFAGPRPAFAQS